MIPIILGVYVYSKLRFHFANMSFIFSWSIINIHITNRDPERVPFFRSRSDKSFSAPLRQKIFRSAPRSTPAPLYLNWLFFIFQFYLCDFCSAWSPFCLIKFTGFWVYLIKFYFHFCLFTASFFLFIHIVMGQAIF